MQGENRGAIRQGALHGAAAGPVIEVAQNHRWGRPCPRQPGQQSRLMPPFMKTQAKMHRDEVQTPIGCFQRCFYRRARFSSRNGQIVVDNVPEWPAADYNVTVVAIGRGDQTRL
jgi:hypothetical protein